MTLYEKNFIPWWEDSLSPSDRWRLESMAEFKHCMDVCKQETGDQFYYFFNKCKEMAGRDFFFKEDIETAQNGIDSYSTEFKVLSGMEPGLYDNPCFERSLISQILNRPF